MLKITPIPAFESNYFWVINPDPLQARVIVVDPGAAQPVIDFLHQQQLTLAAILITHRHHDHIDGVDALLKDWPVDVYGPTSTAIPQITKHLNDKHSLELLGLHIQVIAVPGHTWEHIAYYLPEHKSLFCGDTLFAGGCGRRFDDTDGIMWGSLQKLANLPDDTQIYCAHEYTLANLKFAAEVEPENKELIGRLTQVRQLRAQNKITLPTTIGLEKRTNPFLRCHEIGIKNFVFGNSGSLPESAAGIFDALRHIKDRWPG